MKGALALLTLLVGKAFVGAEVPVSETVKTVEDNSPQVNVVMKLKWGDFSTEIPEHTTKILFCPTGTGLNFKKAEWVATVTPKHEDDRLEPYTFERTLQLNRFCRGHSNCVLQPVAHLEKVNTDYYQFLGVPLPEAKYVLKIEGSCDPNPIVPLGRKTIASIDPKEDLVMGCLEGEFINLSYVRGACIGSAAYYRQLYHNRSFMGEIYQSCQNKRNCTIPSNQFPKDDKCEFKVIDALYYCHNRIHYSYVDIIKKDDKTIHVLTAEEDSNVVMKAPAGKVLSVKSVVWDVIGKESEEADPKRNRLDLIQFYCEGRSSCSFTPRRTSNGLLEMHMGGITEKPEKRFVLIARFDIVDGKEQLKGHEIQNTKATKGEKIEMKCEKGKALRVVSALWGGAVTNDAAAKGQHIFWEEITENGVNKRITEIGAYLEKVVYNKHELQYDPFESSVFSGPNKPQLPLIPGVSENDHVLNVKYLCMDLQKAPSVADSTLNELKSLTEDYDGKYINIDKEKIMDFKFHEDDQFFIFLEQKDDSEIKVGEYITLKIPYTTTKYSVALTYGHEKEHDFEGGCDNVIIAILIADNWRIEITANFYKQGELIKTFVDELLFSEANSFEKSFKDIVVGTGGVVGMRVLHRPGSYGKEELAQ